MIFYSLVLLLALEMRTIFTVFYTSQVCEVYKMHRETYHLTMDFIDRYLSHKRDIPKHHLQLIGMWDSPLLWGSPLFWHWTMKEITPHGERAPSNHWIGCWVDTRAGLDTAEEKSLVGIESRFSDCLALSLFSILTEPPRSQWQFGSASFVSILCLSLPCFIRVCLLLC
jgi:hypothetical protein